MADWFETRVRETVDPGHLDPAFVARTRALVVDEWKADAGTPPPDDIVFDDQEGDIIVLETETRPSSHEPGTPRRHSLRRWLVAAAVLAVVGSALVISRGDGEKKQINTATTPTTAPAQNILDVPDSRALAPGRYFIDPDGDDTTPLRVTYNVAAEGWEPWLGAMKSSGVGHVAVSITVVTNLVTDGCRDHTPLATPVGPTVDDLATALTQLAPFEVTTPPTDVTRFGYQGKHLALTVPDLRIDPSADNFHDFADCVDGELHSWISRNNDGSFFGYETPGYTEEFWILDVQGTRLVLALGTTPGTPAQDIAERDAILDTIRIQP